MKSTKLLSILALVTFVLAAFPACENRVEDAREDNAEAIAERADEIEDDTEGVVEEKAEAVEETLPGE